MEDFFENQDIYLNVAKNRIEKFCFDAKNLLEEVGKNVVMKREGDDFICSLKKLPEKYREIKLSRDFRCITNELRSILDTAVVALSIKHDAPNNNENKLSYRVVRNNNDENEYRKTLRKSGMPEELIETLLHIQPNNKFGSLESGDENIIELLDGANNENKHRGHLQIIYPEITEEKSIYHDGSLSCKLVPINGGLIGLLPFLKIITNDIIIEDASLKFEFNLNFKSDNIKYSNICVLPFLLNAYGAVCCCLEVMKLYENPKKVDFFKFPLKRTGVV